MDAIQSSVGATMPTPEEVFHKALSNLSFEMRVAMPGIIESWNPTTQTASVKLTLREKLNINGNPSWTEIPMLVDVPLVTIRGGGYLICTAINKGDECWVWFADGCFDATWQSSGVQNQIDNRRHDLSDGFFMPSLFSQPKRISNYPTTGIQMRDDAGSTKIEVSSGSINITAATGINIAGGSNIVLGSNTTIDGKNFLTHRHGGVQSGGSSTSGVL
jgi:hypothetical protein